MATNKKTTELDATTWSALADGDQFVVVDVSDTTMASSGTTKRLPKSEIASAASAAVTAHEADTTNVHGIADTSALVTTSTLSSYLLSSAAPELIRDTIGTALTAGSNITITVNDAGDTITIAATASGAVATDAIFDAKGDLPVGTGADTAAKLTVGTNGTLPLADSNQSTGLIYVGAPRTKAPTTAGGCGTYLPDTCSNTTVTTQSSASAQSAWWFPYWLPRRCTPTVNQYCWTLESGSTLRASLWSNNDATFKPSTLLEDLGTMSGAATGAKSVAASGSVGPGWVWVGLWASNHTTVRWNRFAGNWNAALMGDVDPMATRIAFGWTAGSLNYSSAWNSTLPTLTAANSVTNAQAAVPYLTNV